MDEQGKVVGRMCCFFWKILCVGRCLLEMDLELVAERLEVEEGDRFEGMVEWMRES